MKRVRVVMESSGALLALAEMADNPQTRMTGLLGRRGLGPGTGLILDPCRMIHTAFMRFSLDVVFIDRQLHVTRIARDVRPFRLAWGGWRAHYTLELAAGELASSPIKPGDRLFFQPLD